MIDGPWCTRIFFIYVLCSRQPSQPFNHVCTFSLCSQVVSCCLSSHICRIHHVEALYPPLSLRLRAFCLQTLSGVLISNMQNWFCINMKTAVRVWNSKVFKTLKCNTLAIRIWWYIQNSIPDTVVTTFVAEIQLYKSLCNCEAISVKPASQFANPSKALHNIIPLEGQPLLFPSYTWPHCWVRTWSVDTTRLCSLNSSESVFVAHQSWYHLRAFMPLLAQIISELS
jgi:hypothetical protein